jgi:hypothetical protein
MSEVKVFNKLNLKDLRGELDVALRNIGSKYGIDMNIGNISYTSSRFTTKITAVIKSTSNSIEKNPILPINVKFKIGDRFKYKGEDYVVKGYNPRSFKYPYVCNNLKNNKSFKFPETLLFSIFNNK